VNADRQVELFGEGPQRLHSRIVSADAKPIYDALPFSGFLYLLIGGMAYTLGTYFYMNSRIRFGHSIWHLWVLAGSTFHFFSILTLV
jgi:channel protein (hemolysin III family)